jgi:hypothetical protein
VNAGICAARPHDEGEVLELELRSQRGTKKPDHRGVVGLIRKSMKTFAVVGEIKSPPLGGHGFD